LFKLNLIAVDSVVIERHLILVQFPSFNVASDGEIYIFYFAFCWAWRCISHLFAKNALFSCNHIGCLIEQFILNNVDCHIFNNIFYVI